MVVVVGGCGGGVSEGQPRPQPTGPIRGPIQGRDGSSGLPTNKPPDLLEVLRRATERRPEGANLVYPSKDGLVRIPVRWESGVLRGFSRFGGYEAKAAPVIDGRLTRYRLIQKTENTGVLLMEAKPERAEVVCVKEKTKNHPVFKGWYEPPLAEELWNTLNTHLRQFWCTDANHIPAVMRHHRSYNIQQWLVQDEERRIQDQMTRDPKYENSCVYLTLFCLAKFRHTRDWLTDRDSHGPCTPEQVEELCRGWVAREKRGIRLSEFRTSSPAENGTIVHVKHFVHAAGTTECGILLAKIMVPGSDRLMSHAVPVYGPGNHPGFDHNIPFELCFRAPLNAPYVVVKHVPAWLKKGAPQDDPDQPAPKPERKPEKEKAPTVDQMTMDALDEILSVTRPEDKKGKERVVKHEDVAESSPKPVLEPGERECVDCKAPAKRKDSGRPAGRCKECDEKKRDAQKDDGLGDVPKAPPEEKPKSNAHNGTSRNGSELPGGVQVQATETRNMGTGSGDGGPEPYHWNAGDSTYLPVYEGPVNQLNIPVTWRSGYWTYPGTGVEFGCTDYMTRWFEAPDLCAATIDGVRDWGTRTVYVPLAPINGLRITTQGVITDGKNMVQTFKAGSIIKIRWQTYVAVPIRVDFRKLRPQLKGLNFTDLVLNRTPALRETELEEMNEFVDGLVLRRCSSGTIPSCFGVWRFTGPARVHQYDPGVGRLTYKDEKMCKWQGAAKTAKDPMLQGFINIVRSKQADKDRPMDPDDVVPYLQALHECYERPQDVAGPFNWGYCYGGCGAERPGKFHGRLCKKCETENTTLGQWVAQGYGICSKANPVRYPGVVKTEKCHPPLKKSAATRATYGVHFSVTKRLHDGEEVLVPYEDIEALELNTKNGPRLGGVAIDGCIPFVTAGGLRPLCEAVAYRVFKSLVDPKTGKERVVVPEAFARAGALVDSLLPKFVANKMEFRTGQEFGAMLAWVNTMSCGRRRNILLKALMELRRTGYERPKDWEIIKPFVKSENLARFAVVPDWCHGKVTSFDAITYVARLIQAPSEYSHLRAGYILKPMVKMLKEDWCASNWLFYASVGPEALDGWLNRVKHARSWFWSDYTAFDATYSPEAWDLIESIYRRVAPDAPREFWKVLDEWRRPAGKITDRKTGWTLRYFADVCNCSGRDDTALANALLNGMVLACSFASAISGVPLEELTEADIERAKGCVNIAIVGDDSLVACDFDVEDIKEAVEANIRKFGLIAKTETSQEMCDVTFLGMMPYPVRKAGKFQWGPTIGRRVYKAFWQREPDGSLPAWTRGVAQQLQLYRNVPILSELANKVDELLATHKVTKVKKDENRVWAARDIKTDEYCQRRTLDWLAKRYEAAGVTREMIKSDIMIIRGIKRLPAVVKLEAVERILTMDDL